MSSSRAYASPYPTSAQASAAWTLVHQARASAVPFRSRCPLIPVAMQYRRMLCMALALLGSGVAYKSRSFNSIDAEEAGNPIRKVVAMMEKMGKKIEEEGKHEEDLYDKFKCYCKKTIGELEASIQQQEYNPVTPSDIEGREAEISSLEQEVSKLKEERISEEDTLKAAEVQRGKEHEHYMDEHAEDTQVVEQISQAQQALKTGASTALLQKAPMLRAADRHLAAAEKQRLVSFLSGERMDPSYVLGILGGMADDTKEEIVSDDKSEDAAVHTFEDLEGSKKVEISTLLEQFERKMKRIGELKVEVVNLKKSMEGAGQSLADDKKMLAELKSSCDAKAAAWEERQETRSKELIALQETVKILDSDESLDLFRSKAASLLQLAKKGDAKDKKDQALELVLKARREGRPELNFLALALSGRKVDFSKIVKKIDGMVQLLKTEQKDDESKKDYCGKEFHEAELKTKSTASAITSLSATVAQSKGAIGQLVTEIQSLQSGLTELDQSVAQAGENRKAEHQEFQELIASNSQAVQLLDLAKNRLNQFYNPSQFVDTTTKNPFDPYAFLQASSRKVEAPPDTFDGGYQSKMSESHGVFSMIAQLKADIEQEMALAKSDEATSQKDYEKTLADAAEKREADVTLAQEKAKTKADLETDLSDDKSELANKKKEASVVEQVVGNLHKECDWLLKNFDLRAQARAEEKENLVQAKTVLSSMCSTGFPLVDAAMCQLWAVGWMPNYLRHVVAQFLIEYLDLSWKHGLAAGTSRQWQNGGHSGPDHWEFVLHPVNAAKSCDPDGHYVRRWLPFLASCPTEYIHRQVLEVRRKHPEMVSRTGHEWLRLGGGLLAKLVTRQEFRAETEDFIFYQGPTRSKGKKQRALNLPLFPQLALFVLSSLRCAGTKPTHLGLACEPWLSGKSMELRKQPAHVAPARAASTSALRLEASQQASEASETSELCAHVLQTKHTGGLVFSYLEILQRLAQDPAENTLDWFYPPFAKCWAAMLGIVTGVNGEKQDEDRSCYQPDINIERSLEVRAWITAQPDWLEVRPGHLRLRLQGRLWSCELPERVLPEAPLNRAMYRKGTKTLVVVLRRPFASSTWQLFDDCDRRFAQLQEQARRVLGDMVDRDLQITGEVEGLRSVDVKIDDQGVAIDFAPPDSESGDRPLVVLANGKEDEYLPWAEEVRPCSSTEEEGEDASGDSWMRVASRIQRQARRARLRVGSPLARREDGKRVKGHSVFTLPPRREGDLVVCYRGKVTERRCLRRGSRAQRFHFAMDAEWAIDGGTGGGRPFAAHVAGYLNSPAGCVDEAGTALKPNLRVRIDPSQGRGPRAVQLLAARDIEAGEELCFDYGDSHQLDDLSDSDDEDPVWLALSKQMACDNAASCSAAEKKELKEDRSARLGQSSFLEFAGKGRQAVEFDSKSRTIFTKMDFVERIRDVRYRGKCPRILSSEETLLINSFYIRFSQKARAHGIKVTRPGSMAMEVCQNTEILSPVCSQWTQKYKPEAPVEKRSYEWYFPDVWIFLRQLTGLEDLEAAKAFAWANAGVSGLEAGALGLGWVQG
ncbi:CRY2 [Symbiodinium natans]|uniref:CRY2 protein n=1 Tax=Symbiodinium natans TaxID=878477 RepID=A0A812MBQ7_9DINO|nr:CRY2 [Symbiodinium natans]